MNNLILQCFGVLGRGLIFATAVAACSAATLAPVDDRSNPVRRPESTHREVRTGDTLYSIAWETGLDYRDLIVWNQLSPPYIIRPGERLRLYPLTTENESTTSAQHKVIKGDTLYRIAKMNGIRVSDLAQWNQLSPPYVLQLGQILRLTTPGYSVPVETVKHLPTPSKVLDEKNSAITWIWPVAGNLHARFTPNGSNKGIDIAGHLNQSIKAAASGKVVYEGSGLRGYGQLIIIQHNAEFLSAYAHCAETYVKEGDVIKTGQKIAAMGNSGTDQVKLHFEIRRRGVPVNPLEYLPKK